MITRIIPATTVAIASPSIPKFWIMPYTITINAPVGPPICTLHPPNNDTKNPPRIAVINPFSGAYSPEILLDEWGLSVKKKTNLSEKSKLGLATDLDLVYSCLDLRPKNLDHIIRKTGFSPGKTAGILGQLILMGLVKETGRQYYIRLE